MGRKPHPEPLTPAEQRVLEEIRTGATNAEIAVRLGLSINTVKYHVANMLAKTGLDDRAALARWEMPREPGRWAAWRMRAGAAVGVVAVAAVALIGFGLFRESDTAPGAWAAFAPRGTSNDGGLVVLELTSGTRHDLRVEEGWSLHNPVWSPTGEHLLAQEVNRSEGTSRLVVFQRDGWKKSGVDGDFVAAAWSPDGSLAVAAGPTQVTVVRSDGSVVGSYIDSASRFSERQTPWAPDGRHFAILRGPSEVLIGTANGEFWRLADEFRVVGVDAGHNLSVVGWTSDSSALVLVAVANSTTPPTALKVDPATKTVARMGDEEFQAALSNHEIQAVAAMGQDPRLNAALTQLSTDSSVVPPRLLGETADGRGLVFAHGTVNQPDQLIIAYGERQLRIAELPVPPVPLDEGTLSVVLTGDWPSPPNATIPPP